MHQHATCSFSLPEGAHTATGVSVRYLCSCLARQLKHSTRIRINIIPAVSSPEQGYWHRVTHQPGYLMFPRGSSSTAPVDMHHHAASLFTVPKYCNYYVLARY
jgi:hypothetical protein